MKLIIDIPEFVYEHTKEQSEDRNDEWMALRAIANGIPLPKGHGRLIDANAACEDVISALGIRDETYLLEAERAVYKRIKEAPTIVEADKEN